MTLGDISKWIRLHPRYVLPIVIVAFALLLLPPPILAKFGVDSFVSRYRMWVGLVALVGTALVMSHIATSAWRWLSKCRRANRLLRLGKAYLEQLTLEEKQVLAPYLARGTKSAKLDCSDGVIQGLERNMVIMRVSGVSDRGLHFAYNIQEWAWKELCDHRELLEPALTQEEQRLTQAAARQKAENDRLNRLFGSP